MADSRNLRPTRRIPKGFRNKAQGCEERATLGSHDRSRTTLKGLWPAETGGATRPQPRWGCETSTTATQGSSFLATLGFVAESLWDSPRLLRRRKPRLEMSFTLIHSKIKSEAHHRGPPVGQFLVKGQRLQTIIAIVQVQHTHAQFGAASRQAVADEGVALPEVVAGFSGRKA